MHKMQQTRGPPTLSKEGWRLIVGQLLDILKWGAIGGVNSEGFSGEKAEKSLDPSLTKLALHILVVSADSDM
jgi:hypothetical protein